MQFAANADLAAALAPGQVRRFQIKFMVDWALDGGYADPNSDMSDALIEATIDRQLTGNYPAELEITEGYAAAQVMIRLEGAAPDGTSVVRMFSPYSGLIAGNVASINTPCYLDVIVITSSGPVTIRQFTGVIRNAMPVRSGGSVNLILRDAVALLQSPLDVAAWAVDAKLRRSTFDPSAADGGSMMLSWLVDHILRRSGYMQGPPWHPNALIAWTCNGGILPEVGNFASMDRHVRGAYDFDGYLDWQIPHRTPAGTVDEVWISAPDGQLAFTGKNLPDWDTKTETQLVSNGHSISRITPTTYGANDSNLLGFSLKAQLDSGQDSIFMAPTEILFHCEEIRHDPLVAGNQKPSYALLRVKHGDGVVTLRFIENGWVKTWEWTATVNPIPARWINLYAVIRFTSTGITPYLFVDGSPVTLSVTSTPAWPPTAMAYDFATSATNHARVSVYGPANFAQVFYQHDTVIGSLVAPSYTALNQAQVDVSSLRLLWIPKQRNQNAWSLLRELTSAELGVLYITEQGVPTFDNRSTVSGRQDVNNPVVRLTLDQVQDLEPQTLLESVANVLSWELVFRDAELSHRNTSDGYYTEGTTAVFSSTQPGEFAIGGGQSRTVVRTLSDAVMQVLLNVAYEPRAMGYSAPGGGNPNWQQWMQYYTPRFFGNGFTPYAPGSRASPSDQPVPLTGVSVNVALGFTDYTDVDPSHIRLFLANSGVDTAWYAVDDATPFLNVGGVMLMTHDNDHQSVSDPLSITTYGYRSLALQGGPWLQDELTVTPLAVALLADVNKPHPFFETLEIPGDPRIQLQDTVRLDDVEVLGGPIFASVVGIKRRLSKRDGVRDTLTLRTFGSIGGSWVMGDPDFSIMGVTTIVS